MSLRRRIVYSIAAVLILLLAAVALIPLLFRDRIEQRVKAGIASNINARVDWRSLDLSLLRSFPNLSLRLQDLSVTGVGEFHKDTLVVVPQFALVFDLMSVIRKGPIVVRAIDVKQPRVRLLVLENGHANWSIFKEQPPATSSSKSIDVKLHRLAIGNARISFDNRQSGLTAQISGLQHTLSGDFGKEHFTLDTHTVADTASIQFAGVPYLSKARLAIAAQVDANMANHTFVLRENELHVNGLVLKADGSFAANKDHSDVDVKFSAPRTEFREMLSLIPQIYKHDFAKLQASGTMSASGRVHGRIARDTIPAFELQANVNDGWFKYPDLPLPARDIRVNLSLKNPGGSVDSTLLNVDRFHVVLGDDPVDGSLLIRTPKSDPDVGLKLIGRIDLANVTRTLKLDSVKELRGIVIADASMRARQSDVDQKRYDRVNAAGTVEIQRMALNAAGLRQPLEIQNALLRLTPQHAELASFNGRAGTSDLSMNGSLDNLLGFVMRHEVLRGTANVTSRHFNLDEWRSDDALKTVLVPANIDFALRATADTVRYGLLTLRNAHGGIRIKDRRATLEDFSMDMLGGGASVTGFYETVDSSKPAFNVDVAFNEVDIPAAFNGLQTVQLFAPVARYAQGQVSAHMKLNGALGSNMLPVFAGLSALGSFVTKGLVLKSFPPLNALASATKLNLLHDPGFVDVKSSFSMENGRLNVKPFDVQTGPLKLNIAGSNGIDLSLDYAVALSLPNADLGKVHIGGTVTKPVLKLDLREAAANALKPVTERVDSAASKAKEKLIAEAEKRAAQIREEADSLAARMKREGHAQADSLEARATGLKRIAAKLAADRLRKETDAKADAIVREADARAQALVDAARKHQ